MGNYAAWLCQCDCGNEKTVSGRYLRRGKTRSCGCLPRGSGGGRPGEAAITNAFYSHKWSGAKARGYELLLTREQFVAITAMNCTYCGLPPSNVVKAPNGNGDFVYSGIDRKDNSKGYTLANSVPCCKECNISKSDMSMEAWQAYMRRMSMAAIRRHQKQAGGCNGAAR